MVMAHVDFHLFVKAVVHDKTVGHSDTVRLHGMASVVGIVSDIRVVEVGDFLWLSTIGGARRVQRRTILGRVGHGSGLILDVFCRVRIGRRYRFV
jgi:hypothetical protein